MPAATRVGDKCTGHDSCPAVPLIEGYSHVLVNGKPIGVVDCAYQITVVQVMLHIHRILQKVPLMYLLMVKL